MDFENKLISGLFVKRYKRFFVDIKINNQIITAHCPNTGSMYGLLKRGNKVWVSKSNNPNRKLKYTLEIIEDQKMLIMKDINLFVNMVSFQEMPIRETQTYLDIIKTNQSYLYSLNREEKKMYDGEIINYYDFKIREKSKKILFEEQANFYKYYYSSKFPFIHKKGSKVISTLAKF